MDHDRNKTEDRTWFHLDSIKFAESPKRSCTLYSFTQTYPPFVRLSAVAEALYYPTALLTHAPYCSGK